MSQPLQNIEVERAILNGMIRSPDFRVEVLARLTPKCFSTSTHRGMYEYIAQRSENRRPIDHTIMIGEWGKEGDAGEVFGTYVDESMVDEYIDELIDKYKLRSLNNLGQHIQSTIIPSESEIEEKVDLVSKYVYNISTIKGDIDVLSMIEGIARYKANVEQAYATGIEELDELIEGIKKKNLTIISGRPSSGKTALTIDLFLKFAKRYDKMMALFSLEMSFEEIVSRMVSNISGVPWYKKRRGLLTDKDVEAIEATERELENYPIYVNDEVTDFTKIVAIIRRLKNKYKDDFIGCAIDYIQLVSLSKDKESRHQEISYMTRLLKLLAKELDIFVIILSQFSRSPDKREGTDRKPLLSDLKESGSLEENADLVLSLYSEYQYTRKESKKDYVELIVSKQRNGPIGDLGLRFERNVQRFREISNSPF